MGDYIVRNLNAMLYMPVDKAILSIKIRAIYSLNKGLGFIKGGSTFAYILKECGSFARTISLGKHIHLHTQYPQVNVTDFLISNPCCTSFTVMSSPSYTSCLFHLPCHNNGYSLTYYAPNFEKVGRAYCFWLVCLSVCLSVCASVNF